MDRFLKLMRNSTLVIEVLVSLALVVLAAGVLVSLAVAIWDLGVAGVAITGGPFNEVISLVLEVFILIELFRIAVAYMKHENVIPTVLEAALVAIARKFVVFEGSDNYLAYAAGMSALLLAVAVSWWLLARARACELSVSDDA